jgi:hypothetical protein
LPRPEKNEGIGVLALAKPDGLGEKSWGTMTDDVRLQAWHDQGVHPSADHIDVESLERYAVGELSPADARRVNDHLAVCEDARCPDFIRSLTTEERGGEPSHSRTFQSRETIWASFEALSRELNTPIDELVNEAMAAYARVRGYGDDAKPGRRGRSAARPPAIPPARGVAPAPSYPERELEETRDAPMMTDRSFAPRYDDDDELAITGGREAMPKAPPLRAGESADSRTTPRKKPMVRPGALPMPSPPGGGRPGGPPPLPGRMGPPPMPMAPPVRGAPTSDATKRLLITYQGHLYEVDKERFLIGRSKTQADLRLDDPNVSRQHAVVERVGAAWYIVDLGSTNGVHVAGDRVARRAISDGDVIVITSHQLYCSFR